MSFSWIFTGLSIGLLQSSDLAEAIAEISGCDSWVLKTERLLIYMGFIMGACGPGEVVFKCLLFLINRISQKYFGKEYEENLVLLQIVKMVLSYIGALELSSVWQIVRDHSLCLRFHNCEHLVLIQVLEWKNKICNVTFDPDIYNGKEITNCEVFFNESPLIGFFIIMASALIASLWKLRHNHQDQETPLNEATSVVFSAKKPVEPVESFPEPVPNQPDPRPITPPTNPRPEESCPNGSDTQPLNCVCTSCNIEETIQIINPTPIFCSPDCKKNPPAINSCRLSEDQMCGKCAEYLTQSIHKEIVGLLDQVRNLLCPHCIVNINECLRRCYPGFPIPPTLCYICGNYHEC